MVKSAIVRLFLQSLLISLITLAVVLRVGNTDTARTISRNIFAQAPAASNVPNYTSIRANLKMIFTKGITVQNGLNVSGNIEAPGSNLNLGSGNITAANIIYSLVAGDGVSITGNKQNPTIGISNVGSIAVSSIEEIKGDVDLVAGDNVTISKDGNKITIKSSYTDTDTKLTEGEVESYAFDGVAYTWPDSQGGAGTFLQNDGSGNLSWATNSFSISPDSLDFTDFADSMTLDATTNVAMGVYDYHFIGNGGTSAFTIKNSGKVGIGTTDPGKKLEVAGVNEGLRLRHDGTYYADITIDSSGNINLSPYLNSDNAVISLNNAPFIRSNTAAVSLAIGVGANPNMNTSDWGNVAVGTGALQGQTTSYFNTAVGTYAATSLGSGNWLTAVGYAALQNDTVGVNTAVGSQAGRGLVSGMYNTVIGRLGLRNNISGNSNTVLGESAGYNTLGSGNLFLGYGAGYNEAGSNKLYIDNSTTSSPLLWGDFSSNFLNVNGNLGIGTTAPAFPLQVEGNPSAGFGIGSGAPKLAFGWADNSVYHRIRSAGGDNSNIILDLVNPATHYFAVGGDFQVSQGATIGYGIGTARPSSGLAVSGSVGIGTTSPSGPLHIYSNLENNITIQNSTWGTGYHFGVGSGSQYNSGALIIGKGTGAGASNKLVEFNEYQGYGSKVIFFQGSRFERNVGIGYNPSDLSSNSLFVAGNVGIGTTSPTTKLHIVGDMRLTGAFYDSTNSAGSSGLLLTSTGVGTTWSSIAGALGGSVFLNDGNAFGGLATLGTTDANALRFITGGTEAMRVLANGNVGIGTTSPSSQMELNILNAATKGLIVKANSGQTASLVEVQKSDGTALVKFDPYVTNGGTAYLFDTVTNFANPNNGTYLSLKNAGNEILKIYKQTGAGNETYFDLKSAGGASTFSTLFDGGTLNFTKSGVKYLELGGEHYPLFYRNTGVGSNVRGMLSGNGGYGGSGNATFAVAGNAANQVPIVLKGYSGQTANLFEVQNSSNSNLFIIDANGNVGIGTTSPLAKLDVAGTSWLRGSTASSGGLYVNGSGNVGIGTTSPGTPLSIYGTTTFMPSLSESSVAGGLLVRMNHPSTGGQNIMEIAGGNSSVWPVGTGIKFYNHSASIEATAPLYASTSFNATQGIFGAGPGAVGDSVRISSQSGAGGVMSYRYASSPYPDLYFSGPRILFNTKSGAAWADGNGAAYYGTTRMVLDSAGSVGIGTISPSSLLDVAGTSWLRGSTASSGGLYVNGSGNVGIGTTGPSRLLNVNGDISLSGSGSPAIYFDAPSSAAARIHVAGVAGHGLTTSSVGDFVFRSESNLLLGAGLTERVRISSTGNVGIGTTSPSAKLHVYGAGSTSGGLKIESTGTNSPAFYLYASTSTPDAGFLQFGDGTGWKFHIRNSSTSLFTFTDSGRFGINNTSPSAGMDISTTSWLRGSTAASGGLYVNGSGNVGIGTTSPAYKLDVVANTYADGVRFKSYTDNATPGPNVMIGGYNGGDQWAYLGLGSEYYSSGKFTASTSNPTLFGLHGAQTMLFADSGITVGGTYNPTARITILNTSGNVGINNNSPSSILDVAGTSWLRGSTAVSGGLYVDGSGYVGVGTTSPTAKLQINTTVGGGDALILRDATNNANARFYFSSPIGSAPDLHIDAGRLFLDPYQTTINRLNINNHIQFASANILQQISTGYGTGGFGFYPSVDDVRPAVILNNRVTDSASSIGMVLGTVNTLANASAKLLNIDNGTNTLMTMMALGNTGFGTSNPLAKLDVAGTSWLRGSTASSGGLYVNGSGNVGIGTTSPGAKLEVYDGEILLNGSTLGATKQIRSYSDSGKLSLVSGSTTNYQSQIILAARNGGDYISLSTRNNEAMRIDSSGNIGIGTTAPAGKFHVRTGNDENIYIDRASNIYGGTTGVGIGARNDTGLSTASLTLDGTSILIPRTTTFIGLGTTAASFPIDVASSVSSSQTYGYLNSAGTVGTSSGSNSYSIRASSRILASEFNAVSDARLKDVQYELSPDVALNALLQLQPVSYTWKNNPSGQPILGFLAQDVEKVVPNAVSMISTSNFVDQRELNYNQLIAVAIGAIKKQEQKIQQQAEILKGIQNDNVVVETSRRDVSTEQYDDKIASIEATLSSLKTDMDIVKGNSYTASISAFLAANSGSVLGASDSASLSDLIVSGDTNVYDLAVAGDISTGLLKIQGLACDTDIVSPLAGDTCASDISTLGGPLVLQGQAQEELQIMAGKVVVDTSGNITTQGEITVKKVNIDTSDTAAAAAGKSTLEAGKSEITIPTMAVTSNSLIQVTFRGNYAPATRYWIESQKPGESFTLKLDQAVQKNTDFSWMIVN